jgi:hypothetical protein
MAKELGFIEARDNTVENLKEIIITLSHCVDEGMVDLEDSYYNQLLDLQDEAHISKNWDELLEVIIRAKILEIDVAAWLAQKGRTSISLPWPRKPA